MRDEANVLLRKAKQDFGILELMGFEPDEFDAIFGFHAQQAIEKALKAVITSVGHEYPFSHNIAMLMDVLRKTGVNNIPVIKEPGTITVYAVEYRYDSYDEDGSGINRTELLTQVKKVLDWAERIINK